MTFVDLHVHTTHSDGRLSPRAVVAAAAERGLHALAITDHDVLSGLAEAQAAGREFGVEVVPGVELTADWEGRTVHVLGYFIRPDHPALAAALARGRRLMLEHVERVRAELDAVGYPIPLADLARYRTRYENGAALVLAMVERGVLRDLRATPHAGRLLRLASREPRAYTVAEAIALVHAAGGLASLAHPARIRRGAPLLSAADLRPLADLGLDALEAWQWVPGGWGSEHYRRVAAELGLAVTGGSDCHGPRRTGGLRLGGQQVPATVLEALRERLAPAAPAPDARLGA